jgi:cardiolipin synthase A/B
LKSIGVEVLKYGALNSFKLSGRHNFRNHRKEIIIDGLIGYTGGINIGDEYAHLKSKYGY